MKGMKMINWKDWWIIAIYHEKVKSYVIQYSVFPPGGSKEIQAILAHLSISRSVTVANALSQAVVLAL